MYTVFSKSQSPAKIDISFDTDLEQCLLVFASRPRGVNTVVPISEPGQPKAIRLFLISYPTPQVFLLYAYLCVSEIVFMPTRQQVRIDRWRRIDIARPGKSFRIS